MIYEIEAGTQSLDSSLDTIDLGRKQKPDIDSQEIESSANQLPLRSFDKRIRQATDQILGRGNDLCALLVVALSENQPETVKRPVRGVPTRSLVPHATTTTVSRWTVETLDLAKRANNALSHSDFRR